MTENLHRYLNYDILLEYIMKKIGGILYVSNKDEDRKEK